MKQIELNRVIAWTVKEVLVECPGIWTDGTDFLHAVRLGLGWGMVPDLQAHPYEHSGELIDLDPAGASRIALYWQQWKLRSPSLDLVAEAIRGAALTRLEQRARRRAAPAGGR